MLQVSSYKNWLFYLFLIVLLSFLSFYPAFNFSFIVDDWNQLWGVFYDHSIIDHYIKTQHPNSAYEFLFLAPIFKFNPLYYQIIGFILKIIDSLSSALVVFYITASRKAAFFSGLIFAASVIGIETFTRVSAQNSALLIPTICLGLVFWIQASRQNHFSNKYFLSFLFMALSVMADPGTGIIVIPITFLYSLLSQIQIPSGINLKKLIIIIITLGILIVVLNWYLNSMISDRNSYVLKHINFTLQHPLFILTNFLTSIGNLMLGWFVPFGESYISLTSANLLTQTAGYTLIFLTILTGLKFWQKKSKLLKIHLFFFLWIFLFYFPSWFTQSHYVEGGTISAVSNRYFAIPGIGFIGLIAYLITFIKPKYQIILLAGVIGFNIWSSERTLYMESFYRSKTQQDFLYRIIDQDLPKGDEKNDLLLFLGYDWFKTVELDWNGFYPLAIKRNITKEKEFPTIVSSVQQVKDLICSDHPKFRLSKFYAWEFQNNQLYNITDQVRQVINTDKKCRYVL